MEFDGRRHYSARRLAGVGAEQCSQCRLGGRVGQYVVKGPPVDTREIECIDMRAQRRVQRDFFAPLYFGRTVLIPFVNHHLLECVRFEDGTGECSYEPSCRTSTRRPASPPCWGAGEAGHLSPLRQRRPTEMESVTSEPRPEREPLYNSQLETATRAMVILNAAYPRALDLARLTWFDHLVCPHRRHRRSAQSAPGASGPNRRAARSPATRGR
jgi:hypothetical protein